MPEQQDEPWPASESCGDEDEPEEENDLCPACGGSGEGTSWSDPGGGTCTRCGGSGELDDEREDRYEAWAEDRVSDYRADTTPKV